MLEVRDDLAKASGLRRLLVWRDDRAPGPVGGAKARNLRRHLETMRDRGCDTLLITARAGSNLVMAASRMAPARGIAVTAVLRPQPDSREARRNLAVAIGCGTDVVPASLAVSLRRDAPFVRQVRDRLAAEGRTVSLIGFGGGEEDAGHAHARAFGQMTRALRAAGQSPPETIYMAAASFSSGVGLACALAQAGWPTTLVLVNVAQDVAPGDANVAAAACALAQSLGAPIPAGPAIRIVDRLAPGFGRIAPRDLASAAVAFDVLGLDITYTAKAFAALCEDARSGVTDDALFWHSGTGRSDLPEGISPAIPSALADLLLFPARSA